MIHYFKLQNVLKCTKITFECPVLTPDCIFGLQFGSQIPQLNRSNEVLDKLLTDGGRWGQKIQSLEMCLNI